jgi:hypothetical protein
VQIQQIRKATGSNRVKQNGLHVLQTCHVAPTGREWAADVGVVQEPATHAVLGHHRAWTTRL